MRASKGRVVGLGGAVVAVVLCCQGPAQVRAQGVAQSGMGQGQASINVRSDVTLAIKGLRSTTPERLSKLTELVSDKLPALRKCYRELIAKRPTSVGSIGIKITLEQGDEPPALELKEYGGTDADLTGCVKHVLEHAPLRKLERPVAAAVTLQFENTRAKGEAEMARRREAAAQVNVHERTGGGFEAAWTADDGKVGFTVGSAGSREAVEAVLNTLRTSFAGFADCRRRSEKGGVSPAGALQVELHVQSRGKGSAKVTSSTVSHPRATPCVERLFKRLRFKDAPAGETLDIQVQFGA